MHRDVAAAVARSVFGGQPVLSGWRNQAVCADMDRDLFFGRNSREREKAQRVCRGCPVRASCLAFALGMSFNPQGIWGGTTPWERTRLRNRSGAFRLCHQCGRSFDNKSGEARFCGDCRVRAGRLENVSR